MKIACIGDIHGSPRWTEALDTNSHQYVFAGDYVDSEEFDDEQIIHNLERIIEFKQKNTDCVSLLLGNHDCQYIHYPNFRCTGFRPQMLDRLQSIFSTHSSLFQIAQQFGNHLFTHAGVTRRWANEHLDNLNSGLSNQLNNMIHSREGLDALSEVGIARGGDTRTGSPLWCDYHEELLKDPLPNVHQIVGHTRSKYLWHNSTAGISLWNVNYLAYSNESILILDIEPKG